MSVQSERRKRWVAGQKAAAGRRPTVEMERWFEVPKKWTFQMPKLRRWVESRLEGDVLNLFGGFTRLDHPGGASILYNDRNLDLEADYRRDSYNLLEWQDAGGRFGTVILDPPFTAYQAVRTYGITRAQEISHAREVALYALKPGGRIISIGYNSTGMSESRGFVKESIALVNTGASHNDYIALCERHLTEDAKSSKEPPDAGIARAIPLGLLCWPDGDHTY